MGRDSSFRGKDPWIFAKKIWACVGVNFRLSWGFRLSPERIRVFVRKFWPLVELDSAFVGRILGVGGNGFGL